MLNADDIEWMKANRSEIRENRTVSVTLVHESATGKDPITGEPITQQRVETVQATWQHVVATAEQDRSVVAGIELRKDDVQVTFDANVVLDDVSQLYRSDDPNAKYTIIADDPLGIGAINRHLCLVRRST